MARTTIDHLIINSPYEEPKHHWSYDRESRTFDLSQGGRPVGYVIASQSSLIVEHPDRSCNHTLSQCKPNP